MDATGINVTLSPSLHRATITFEGVVGIGVLAPENIGFDLHARIVSGDIVAPILAVGIEPLAVIAFPFDLAPNRDQFRTWTGTAEAS
jgi:hypothetical protein